MMPEAVGSVGEDVVIRWPDGTCETWRPGVWRCPECGSNQTWCDDIDLHVCLSGCDRFVFRAAVTETRKRRAPIIAAELARRTPHSPNSAVPDPFDAGA